MKIRLRIAALLCLQFAMIAQGVQTRSLRGHVPAAVAHLTTVGRLEATRELKLAIGLPLRNRDGLTNLLQRIYDPASPDYHHYLTPAQFAETFGPTEEDYRAVTAFAKANGFKVTATHSNRTLLDVTGSVSNIEKTFHVTMRTYRHPRENRMFYAPDVEPSLDLAAPVLHISGLDNYFQPRPMSLRKTPQSGSARVVSASGSGPSGAYMGDDFRAAYVPGLALNGTGQTVGLVEFDGYYPSDISTYAGIAGVPAVPLTNVYLDGFTGIPGQNNVEVALDIDMAVCMAPGLSSVIVYEGVVTDDILNRMATDALANQLSSSWTYPINAVTEQIFQQFAAQGQSFFNAAGDSDAWIGEIATPSDDPNITSVGGTTLTTSGPAGAWVSETVWNWDVEYGPNFNGQGGGGGISTTYAIPSWQLGVSMTANHGSTSFRNIPDVALTADNVFVVADDGQDENVGGTSCATPLWAAFVALANEQAVANGRPTLGFLNPAIYAIGLSVNYTNCFHDITTGNNTWSRSPTLFYAVPAYDLCSGWGTPMGSNLVNLLALDSLQISPPGGLTSSGIVGGPLTPATQSYTLTNSGNAPLNWAAATTVPWLILSLNGGTLTPAGAATTVLVSLNAAASNLFLGTYGATIWFTNLTDGTVQSRAFSLAIIKPPVILAQPASLAVIGGTTATFTAGAAGGLPLHCQWQYNGINMADGGRVSGSQSTLTDAENIYGSFVSTLTISNVVASDGGTYALVASNAVGVVVSSNAVLVVVPSGPVIIQQPATQTVLVGATVQFAVAADGAAPFTYQWQQNETDLTDGGNVSGSLTPTLTINGASSASIGTYSVVVGNALGTTTSTGAVLTVQVAVPGGQLVQNGGFETGSFSSWTETGNFADASVNSNSTAVHSGNYGAFLGAAGSLGYLSQSLPTVAGQLYLLSLWLDSPDGIS
ncbi:MAG TPA: protease pro-enzyme activation domain-containing protein, partial [Candidatus Saccharimonadales bacterium]|nr:protease pro-enzyme activation domain-containing protein [Candidatus Saccharimonadales bacterium]